MNMKRKAQRSKGARQSVFLERRNAYVCKDCRHITLTVDIHEGTTPFMIDCEKCKGMAQSFMYQLPGVLATSQASGLTPTQEWYNPIYGTPPEEIAITLDALGYSIEECTHIEAGGLLLRPRSDAKPIRDRRS